MDTNTFTLIIIASAALPVVSIGLFFWLMKYLGKSKRKTLSFQVQGSAQEPYSIVFKRIGHIVLMTCTCPTGEKQEQCKHRVNLALGDATNLVVGEPDLDKLPALLKGSDIDLLISEFTEGGEKLPEAGEQREQLVNHIIEIMNDPDRSKSLVE